MLALPALVTVSARTIYIELLAKAIETKHRCKPVHLESVPVTEVANGQTIWTGMVQVFELTDHPTAKRCFAWIEVPTNFQRQFVMVLQKGLVISPETAVKAWLGSKTVTVSPVQDSRPMRREFPELDLLNNITRCFGRTNLLRANDFSSSRESLEQPSANQDFGHAQTLTR